MLFQRDAIGGKNYLTFGYGWDNFAPVASTNYTVSGSNAMVAIILGGTGADIKVYSPTGLYGSSVIDYGDPAVTPINRVVPKNWIINFGAFSVAPTVLALPSG
jgi:hypothetical protein